MKPTIDNIRDSFSYSYEAYKESREEALKVLDLYHNRQYTSEQINTLNSRGQPVETFNIIKMFGRILLGYYSTIVNKVKVLPLKYDSIITAQVLQDSLDNVFKKNNFISEGDKIKLDCILTGVMCCYIDVEELEETDEFGRKKYKINMHHVPSIEIVLDPMSNLDDYSDARFIHRYKWIRQEEVDKLYGEKKRKEIDAYYNFLGIKEADFAYKYNIDFVGVYKRHNNYLIVHSIIKDDNGKTWSIHWCQDTILSKAEITYKDVQNPYRIQKLNTSNKVEFYGLFREVTETQKAINQALIKLQLMVNTQKAFVQDGAVDDYAEFAKSFNRVNSIIPVKDLAGIRIENLTADILSQYSIIDKGLERIKQILSINDSFLGMAFASDSGRKVKIQQNASIVAQRYATGKIEHFYRMLGNDIMNLIKQYYTAHDIIRVSDDYAAERWVEINKPLMVSTGEFNAQTGEPILKYVYEEVLDPATRKPIKDSEGRIVIAPIPTLDTDIAFSEAEVDIEAIAFNDQEGEEQLFLDSFMNSGAAAMLSQVNPAGYLKIASMSVRNTRSKYSAEISNIIDGTAKMILQQQALEKQAMQEQIIRQQMLQEQSMREKKQE